VKDKKSAHRNGVCRSVAFTLVELLTVLGIIAIVVALLIPALTAVRDLAKETQQKAQLTTIELALTAFKHDYGDYPPSHGYDSTGAVDPYYSGAQTLAEALVGWDLMGFHPNSAWRADGEDKSGGDLSYDPTKGRDDDGDNVPDTLKERKGPYLELATANTFSLDNLFTGISSNYNPDAFVICDVFGKKPVTVGGKTVMAGLPILYYKANTSSKTIDSTLAPSTLIYNRSDNSYFVYDFIPASPLRGTTFFYDYIRDPRIVPPAPPWPSRPESYLLISAGSDGLYGTRDDICNFDPNIPSE
jgi:type II secretory pathway pseudopilin PulG